MASKRTKEPEARRGDLITAAWKVFREKGVARATVSDIVKASGVAQGTFYLYFREKNDLINALVERMVDEMIDAVERVVKQSRGGAVAGFSALRDALLAAAEDPAGLELTEIYHRPENRAVHDRMAERLLPRLLPIVENIVRQGLDEGVFVAENPRLAAWFVLGGLHAFEFAFADRAGVNAAVTAATGIALRALGYRGPAPTGA